MDQTRTVSAAAALIPPPAGRISICRGGADTVTAPAFVRITDVLDFVKTTSQL
ncbi:MAG: hypothetical protein JW748_00895 [Anaerolineales bacterium]|nr:hypothetical protein [Anaerolineales bacterium]